MISGWPPTERKARTGELTPPTRTFSASANISRERRWLRRDDVWVTLIFCLCSLHGAHGVWWGVVAAFYPSSGVLCCERQNAIGGAALDGHARVRPGGVFVAADVVGGVSD